MESSVKHAIFEVLLGAAAAGIFCLFSVALFAVFVRAYAPPDVAVAVVNRFLKGLGAFLGALLFVRPGRALFKGIGAGVLSLLLTTFIFGLIGGFHIGILFLAEFLLCAAMGALGGMLGAKLRKE